MPRGGPKDRGSGPGAAREVLRGGAAKFAAAMVTAPAKEVVGDIMDGDLVIE